MSVFRDAFSTPTLQVAETLVALAFWGAILLPFVYLPLLVTGLESTAVRLVFAVLVSFNIVLLILGHPHRG